MTEKELKETKLLGSVKARILEVAKDCSEMNNEPLEQCIERTYHIYVKCVKNL